MMRETTGLMNHLPRVFGAVITAAACVLAVDVARTPRSRAPRTGADAEQVQPIAARDEVQAVASSDGTPTDFGDERQDDTLFQAAPGVVLAAADGVDESRRREADREDARTRKTELEELRRKLAALEEQMGHTRSERELLQHMTEQFDAIRGDLAEREAGREAEAAAAQQAVARRQQALDALTGAERRLATGDSQVLEVLDGAIAELPYPSQRAVQNARSAVESKDLFRARVWISVALAQTQAALIRQ